MPRVSPKVNQSMNSSTRSNKGNRSNQIRANGAQIAVIKNGQNSGSGGSNGRRNHSGQSTLPSSPNNSGYEKFINAFIPLFDISYRAFISISIFRNKCLLSSVLEVPTP